MGKKRNKNGVFSKAFDELIAGSDVYPSGGMVGVKKPKKHKGAPQSLADKSTKEVNAVKHSHVNKTGHVVPNKNTSKAVKKAAQNKIKKAATKSHGSVRAV